MAGADQQSDNHTAKSVTCSRREYSVIWKAYMPSPEFSGGFKVCQDMFQWGVRRDYLKIKNKAYFIKKKIIEVYLQWCIQEWYGLRKHSMHRQLLCWVVLLHISNEVITKVFRYLGDEGEKLEWWKIKGRHGFLPWSQYGREYKFICNLIKAKIVYTEIHWSRRRWKIQVQYKYRKWHLWGVIFELDF